MLLLTRVFATVGADYQLKFADSLAHGEWCE